MIENQVFALDIGTHSVVGILGSFENGVFCAKDYARYFHKRGAMRDGQIEDISMVARAVMEVKGLLEERNDCQLKNAAIAAAGRLLLTKKVEFEQTLPEDSPITADEIRSLEYSALSGAVEQFTKETDENLAYSCVGYSVMGYWLDDYQYSNLEGHQGSHVKIQMIAAFLPFSVIRSLYAVTEKCGLKVDSLTLEPIAAINAIVPRDIRLLNIAIADIGAGTSDIAISRNGSIVAYAMATIAGDEITEAIMRHYLVDFDTAEQIKYTLSENQEEISYRNILGVIVTCSREEVFQVVEETVDQLCKEIARNILEINEAAPVAVFLTGGGSQVPTLCERIARELGLPEERVGLGGQNGYKNIQVECEALLTPEFVTPLGIGATYHQTSGHDSFSITVNGEKILIPQTNDIKVMDALLLAGIKASDLIGSNPRPLEFILNGERKTVRGTRSLPGEIFRNGKAVSLNERVLHGDDIKVIFAKAGDSPAMTAGELLKETREGAYVLINGVQAEEAQEIQNGDLVEVMEPEEREPVETESAASGGEEAEGAAADFESDKQEVGVSAADSESGEWKAETAETEKKAEQEREEEPIDFIEVLRESMSTILEDSDPEEAAAEEKEEPREVAEVDNFTDLSSAIGITVPAREAAEAEPDTQLSEEAPLPGQVSFFPEEQDISKKKAEKPASVKKSVQAKAQTIKVTLNGNSIEIQASSGNHFQFLDLLNYVELDTKNPQGDLVLLLNGAPAGYTDPLLPGDTAEIRWSSEKNF